MAQHSIVAEHLKAGRVTQAVLLLRAFLRKNPGDDLACFLIGNALSQTLQHDQAEHYTRAAVHAKPADPNRRASLVQILHRAGKHEEAIQVGLDAIGQRIESAALLTALAEVLAERARAGEAVALLDRAITLEPRHAPSYKSLGRLHASAGSIEHCIENLRQAAMLAPNSPQMQSTLCFYLNYSPDHTRETIFAEHVALGKLVGRQAPPEARTTATIQPNQAARRLRLAYLSHDVRQHSVAYFIEPLLRHHDRERFHVTLVSTTIKRDAATDRLAGLSDRFIESAAQDAAGFVDAMRKERFDFLIELNGLTGGTRVFAMAARLAHVQATYLGYPNTTGIDGVDFRIVDGITDPRGTGEGGIKSADEFCTEKLLRVPGCFMCYQPHASAPGVTARNAATPFVFGSFNKSDKISSRTIDLWSRALQTVPGSVLMLKAAGFDDPWVRERVLDSFAARGIGAERLRFQKKTRSIEEHLSMYAEVDVALDTFPYNGATTTCEALWMGVPVVTLAGESHASRVGASLLTACGLERFIADSPDEFVRIAASLSQSAAELRVMRSAMRDRVASSPLCDGPGFAHRFEGALLEAWREKMAAFGARKV